MRRIVVVLTVVLAGCIGPAEGSADVPQLTVSHGCGYGLYLGSADQTAGLFLHYLGAEPFQAGDVTGTYQLPADAWAASLRYGHDLFANWCDDVIEPGEPEPRIEEEWQVTGTVEIVSAPSGAECGPASAVLTDLVAHNDEGEVLPIGDYDVVNETWGCFAG